ncbi:hypothetical protein KM043_009812 [Ampulex compressa]|nr:hypothetical protein KM043_009812 [Ampulex compressa]
MDEDNFETDLMLPFGPPPIWPDIKSELKEYIECPENLPIHQVDNTQAYWPWEPNVLELLDYDLAPSGTTLRFDRDPVTGRLGKMHEVVLKSANETARNSMSMSRAPCPFADDIRGNSSNIPFWPGGFDMPVITESQLMGDIDFEKNLRTLAKGFSAGIEFKSDNCTPKEEASEDAVEAEQIVTDIEEQSNKINLMAVVQEEGNIFDLWDTNQENKSEVNEIPNPPAPSTENIYPLPDDSSIPILVLSDKPAKTVKTEWAEQLDVTIPVTDFEKLIPDPAITFEYELDTFQKQAILKLEENCNVFVAAHTSAGKTTVAEYAIALSQKHMTKVIYTSPIKALSNQKYRDFKNKFESIGLLTGDVQINQTASCLIMTTEILQSMLYCASEVLRDLEFVIFDEVHYINNEDRGHVWEESVILLPKNVRIVMLSATVPNPLSFAEWVGQIKKQKTYVISTLKRPIPLQHYLYTGTDATTKGEKFLIVDSDGQFLLNSWYQATHVKNGKDQKAKNPHKSHLTQKQEHVLWNAFINHLKSNNMLPVVVFTLSRRRCDMNASVLKNIDLTTKDEKNCVFEFFKDSIKHLKGTDRQLPQILMMQALLQKGIGIHHSGILPIIKEIVEMLFQKGVVKLLFATETFAMGVNMPARTVVFDSIQKYDGNSFRTLYPTEYIQMAGRAGRRGHDTTGTVIVLCRNMVPHFNELKKMMCGQAQTLESKFKVTYAMVLNLKRINESVTIEAMMRRSFKESSILLKHDTYKTELQKLEMELSRTADLTDMQKELSEFYYAANEYIEYLKYLRPNLLETKEALKSLTPGRVLLISYAEHYNKLALLLAIKTNRDGKQYHVLVLKNSEQDCTDDTNNKVPKLDKSEKWYEIIALTKKEIFVPNKEVSHEVLLISAWHVLEITNCQIKIDCELVLADWERREIPRFKNNLPGKTCNTAVQELMTISLDAVDNAEILLPYVNLNAARKFSTDVVHLQKLKHAIEELKCIEIPNFEEQFEVVFEYSRLELKKKNLEFKLSDEGLSLFPEYVHAVALLKHLGYIDNDDRVALKGRVALQMGSNELLITELILKNVLTVLQPFEIAALLSALIFHQRTDARPTLTPELKKGCEIITQIYTELESLEASYGLTTLLPLNFGLVEVVYEWAQAKSFAEIMEKTDVQEGIIVRCIQQLSETLQDVKNAAVTIGDPVLKEKMEEAFAAIKRDIVFAASLYILD